jgi:alpha-L-rhamnosidase
MTDDLGDWLAMDERTPSNLVNNAIYIHMMEVTATMAEAVGRSDYARTLRERRRLALTEWNQAFVDPASGKTRSLDGKTVHTQTSYATPLNFNVFDETNQPRAVEHLAALAISPNSSGPQKDAGKNDFQPRTITTGFSGTPNILPALSRAGRWKEAYSMFICTSLPSWLYPVTKGATSVWERWNGYEAAFSDPNENSMNSFNHFALGSVGQWMYEYQLGISPGEDAGYKHFVLQPVAGGAFLSLEGSYESDYGRIVSSWTADPVGIITSYTATVPANSSATLYLPVSENITSYGGNNWVSFKGTDVHNGVPVAVYELDSGTHNFSVIGNAITVK